jgi:tetratricopeptide (TPR) repeat protein
MIAKKRGLYTQAEPFYRVWAPSCRLPACLSFVSVLSQQALTAFDRAGKTYGVSTVLCNLGDLARKQERYEAAIELYNRALGIFTFTKSFRSR